MISPLNRQGFSEFFLRLLLLPLYFFLLWNFYYPMQKTQSSFASRGGLLVAALAGTALLSAGSTAEAFVRHRGRYYAEARMGHYRGPLFLVAHFLFAAPLAFLSVMAATAILFFGLDLTDKTGATGIDWIGFMVVGAVLYTVWGFIEQQTIAIMLVIKSRYTTAITSITITVLYLMVGAASLRSLVGMPEYLYYLGHVNMLRYSSAVLHELVFADKFVGLPVNASIPCGDNNAEFGCRYRNGTYYLLERFHFPQTGLDHGRRDLDLWSNCAFSLLFYGGLLLTNLVLYLVPLPAFVKSKFRD